ncbi:uncharacterized protein [Paramisgurnus dabryanus]
MLSGTLPVCDSSDVSAVVRGIEMGFVPVPLHRIYVQSDLVTGFFTVGVRTGFPIEGIELIIGNDIAGGKVFPVPRVVSNPILESEQDELGKSHPHIFVASVTTRAQSREKSQEINLSDSLLASIFFDPVSCKVDKAEKAVDSVGESDLAPLALTPKALIKAQRSDPSLIKCFDLVVKDKIECNSRQPFFLDNGVLMRRWVSPTDDAGIESDIDWKVVCQVVAPVDCRQQILSLAHEHLWAGHLGISKTYNRVLKQFFWPGLKRDVTRFCKTCRTCQVVGKPNQCVPPAPLQPIPVVGEPFEHVIVDCVGPLPKTKAGNQFLLTVMCLASRFPEAIPLRRITAVSVTKALVKFFTTYGLPKVVQTDQGTNFLSKVFKQTLSSLGITHSISSAYHPESQGVLERWHQTLKSMLKKYCHETCKDWDEGVPFVLFAARDTKQESLGFSPAELVFGHNVRGPLKMLREKMMYEESPKTNVLDFVSRWRERLHRAVELARESLSSTQTRMKKRFDQKAVDRQFNAGDKVLVLLPVPGSTLTAKFSGPYDVERKVSETDYIIRTPDRRRKTRLCHINMLKPFHSRDVVLMEPVQSPTVAVVGATTLVDDWSEPDLATPCEDHMCGRLANSEFMTTLVQQLSYLPTSHQQDVIALLRAHPSILNDIPSRTTVLEHDIDVGDARPIKQHAYRSPIAKREAMKREVHYLVKHGLAKTSYSPWSSPCLLTPKSDGTFRFCTDFRKVNAVTVSDSFPLPRMDDLIDRVGPAKCITKLDLLKGYWQVPLTQRASEISAFVTPDVFMQYTVMPFGVKNAPATFQRLMQLVLGDIPNCSVYLDDVVVYSEDWDSHMSSLKTVCQRLADASLTLNLAKCEFGKAMVTYLGKQVGQGQVRPLDAKVAAILALPIPTTRRELRRFLGMAGYYRCFCQNFSVVVAPLTRLCSPFVPFLWDDVCNQAFEAAKSLLCSAPVLAAPNFSQSFYLEVDASATGAGAVLMQKGDEDMCKPVCYFSAKFKKHQLNYSTIEKETLAMLLALQHFEVYVGSSFLPITVYTDHNPLVFLARMYNSNQRLMRWALLAQGYNLHIKHKRGVDNILADALSRG